MPCNLSFFRQILKTRENLLKVMRDSVDGIEGEEEGGFPIKIPEIPEIEISIPKEDDTSASAGPKLYVRDDGTVDWEGALQDRAALRKFGGAVWARINGQTPDDVEQEDDESTGEDRKSPSETNSVTAHKSKKAVTANIEETPAISKARQKLKKLQDDLLELEKSHTALLNSGKHH